MLSHLLLSLLLFLPLTIAQTPTTPQTDDACAADAQSPILQAQRPGTFGFWCLQDTPDGPYQFYYSNDGRKNLSVRKNILENSNEYLNANGQWTSTIIETPVPNFQSKLSISGLKKSFTKFMDSDAGKEIKKVIIEGDKVAKSTAEKAKQGAQSAKSIIASSITDSNTNVKAREATPGTSAPTPAPGAESPAITIQTLKAANEEARATINKVRPLMIVYSSYPSIQPAVVTQYNTVMQTVSILQAQLLPSSEALVLQSNPSQDQLTLNQQLVVATTQQLKKQIDDLYNAIMSEKKRQDNLAIGVQSFSSLSTQSAQQTFNLLETSKLFQIDQPSIDLKQEVDQLCIQLQITTKSSSSTTTTTELSTKTIQPQPSFTRLIPTVRQQKIAKEIALP